MIDSTLSDWDAEKKRLAAGFGRSLGSLTSPAPVPPFRGASAGAAGPSPYRRAAALPLLRRENAAPLSRPSQPPAPCLQLSRPARVYAR